MMYDAIFNYPSSRCKIKPVAIKTIIIGGAQAAKRYGMASFSPKISVKLFNKNPPRPIRIVASAAKLFLLKRECPILRAPPIKNIPTINRGNAISLCK